MAEVVLTNVRKTYGAVVAVEDLSLAIADLTVGLIVMPISSAYVLAGHWMFGEALNSI